jgi:hypothetical protein
LGWNFTWFHLQKLALTGEIPAGKSRRRIHKISRLHRR